eukprot:3791975-Alexandrium_andersonii.AAC.1
MCIRDSPGSAPALFLPCDWAALAGLEKKNTRTLSDPPSETRPPASERICQLPCLQAPWPGYHWA